MIQFICKNKNSHFKNVNLNEVHLLSSRDTKSINYIEYIFNNYNLVRMKIDLHF